MGLVAEIFQMMPMPLMMPTTFEDLSIAYFAFLPTVALIGISF